VLSNQLTILLDEIQFRKNITLEEIAETIGYSRPYLTSAKNSGRENKKLIGIIKETYSEILQNGTGKDKKITIDYDKESMVKDIMQLKALVKMLRARLAKTEAKVFQRDLDEIADEQEDDTRLNLRDLIKESRSA